MPTMVERFYLKIDGITPSDSAGVPIEGFSWGETAGAGQPQFTDLQVSRTLDQFSSLLFRGAARGSRAATASLVCRQVDAAGIITTITYTFGGVQINSYNHAGNQHGGLPTESLSLGFQKLEFTFSSGVS